MKKLSRSEAEFLEFFINLLDSAVVHSLSSSSNFLGLLLIYVGVFVPFRVAFFDEVTGFMLMFETLIDLCFAVDIVLTFFTAYEKNKSVEVRHSKIAKQYLKGWFIIDLIATIPF